MSNFRRPFTDAKQQDYAQCAIDLDVKLSHNYIEYTYYDETVWPMIIALCSDSDAGVIRYCQAMITEMGRVNRQKMDVIASFMVWYYEKIKKSSKNYPIAIPPIEDIASLINLYLSQICPWDFDHRIANICLLMMKMGDWYPEEQLVVLFSDQVMTFFIGCLYNNPDKWTQLYTLFNLMFSSNFECIKKIIFDNCTLRLAVKQNSAYLCQFKPISLYRARDDNFLLFQIGSCAQWLMKNVFDADKIIDDDDIPLREENDVQPWDTDVVVVDYPVESEDQSKDKDSKSDESDEQLESDESDKQSSDEDSRSEVRTSTTMKHLHRVTTDNLSVIGCHFAWQDYQFTKPVDITSGQVFYYEVILLTTGSIRIGWATKLNDFGFYGFSSDPDSISFDAFEKQICAQRESQFFRKLPPVSACDVVGCFLDTSLAGTVYFQFYLNGKEVGPHRWEGRRLSLSKGFVTYYPTVSLSGCQQVYFNFGQMPYRYSPLLPVHYFTSLIKPLVPVFDISSRMFVDDTQKKFEQWMLHFDWSIAEGASDDELSELGSKLLKVAQFQWNSELRLMQAMIEQMGIIDESKVQVSALWMEFFFKKVIVNPHVTQPVQLILKLLQPYLNLQDICMDTDKEDVPESVISKSYAYSRNVCLLIAILPSLLTGDNAICKIDSIIKRTVPFLVSLVVKNKHDSAAKLYALCALKSLAKSTKTMKEELSAYPALLKHIELISERSDSSEMEGKEESTKCSLSEKEIQMIDLCKLISRQLNISTDESVSSVSCVV